MKPSPDNPNVSFTPTTLRGLEAERGTLPVPMRRDAPPGAPRIELKFIRLPARTPHPGDPIVFLTGGPGMSAIRQGEGRLFPLFDRLRRLSDVILLDQRGSGSSNPLDASFEGSLPGDRALTREQVLGFLSTQTRVEAGRARERGLDLSAFNTVESADDVADLVRALCGAGNHASNHPRVALLGWSYGTHLAMAVMRRHPALVSRAVLACPEGPDHTYKLPSRIQRQLEDIARRVRADAAWGTSMPDLIATMRRVFERVEKEPVRIEIPWMPDPIDVTIGRFDLEWMTAEGIADTRFLRRMPLLFAALDRGDFSFLADDRIAAGYILELHVQRGGSLVRCCMDCASGASAARRERIEREAGETLLGRTIDFPFPEICAAVGSPDLGDDFRTPQRCDVPVLFITGTLDCRTPAENYEELAPAYPHSRHLVVEDAGHGDLLLPGGVHRAIERFFGTGEMETSRVQTDEPFAFERL